MCLARREPRLTPPRIPTARRGALVRAPRTAQYAEAEAPMRRVIELNEAHRGATHVETARAVNNLATLLRMRKRHAEARPLMERALEVRTRAVRLALGFPRCAR